METINSKEYIEVKVLLEPFSEEAAEMVEAEIAELPYDMFMVEEPFLKCYIPKGKFDARQMKIALDGASYAGSRLSFSANLVEPENWNARWESDFDPIRIRNQVVVKAVGSETPPARFNISISPQMAFGTGHHHTTYMMMEGMLRNELKIRDKVILDMGCGTGILGILAAKMRALRVYGIDIDAVAAQSAFDNARINRVGRRFETYCGDASLIQAGRYDVILANIHRNIILMDMRTYSNGLRKGGILMTSGFLADDCKDIAGEASACGLMLSAECEREGWACLEFSKK